MKIPVYALDGKQKGEVPSGKVFSVPVRTDVIKRAFMAELSVKRQPYGANPRAGKRTSAHYHGKRHYRYSMMNREMARMKRIHNQGPLNMTARFVPQATKGRKAHPPKSGKVWTKKINKKERIFALLSAISASGNRDYVPSTTTVPIVFEDKFQELKKTKEITVAMKSVGLVTEEKKKVRAGRGKSRGRKYKKSKGPLIIVNSSMKAGPAGCDVVNINDITVSDLAPGGVPGRICVWTESSFKELEKIGGNHGR